MTERPYYIPPRHEPLDEPIPVKEPPRLTDIVHRPSKWDSVINRLKAHVGQWFIICEYSGTGAPPTYLTELASRRECTIEMCERVGGPKGNRTTRIYARAT